MCARLISHVVETGLYERQLRGVREAFTSATTCARVTARRLRFILSDGEDVHNMFPRGGIEGIPSPSGSRVSVLTFRASH
jgi:hypothetical protein